MHVNKMLELSYRVEVQMDRWLYLKQSQVELYFTALKNVFNALWMLLEIQEDANLQSVKSFLYEDFLYTKEAGRNHIIHYCI